MEKNVGMIDQAIRVIVGLALAAWYLGYVGTAPGYPLNIGVLLLSVIMLATGVLGYCCLYKALGWSTAEKAPEQKAKKGKKK
ncbi:Uncharacterised protein [uncultured archaeon]|nr:Uncharacterised protein [uncultured archaeon]